MDSDAGYTSCCPAKTPADHRNEQSAAGDENQLIFRHFISHFFSFIVGVQCCHRFKKCLSIGMEKSWVMTEEERLQMLKSRLERRQRPDTEERGTASSTSFPGNHSTGSSSPTASSIGSHISSCNSRSLNSLKRLREQYVPRVDTVHRYLSEAEVSHEFGRSSAS